MPDWYCRWLVQIGCASGTPLVALWPLLAYRICCTTVLYRTGTPRRVLYSNKKQVRYANADIAKNRRRGVRSYPHFTVAFHRRAERSPQPPSELLRLETSDTREQLRLRRPRTSDTSEPIH